MRMLAVAFGMAVAGCSGVASSPMDDQVGAKHPIADAGSGDALLSGPDSGAWSAAFAKLLKCCPPSSPGGGVLPHAYTPITEAETVCIAKEPCEDFLKSGVCGRTEYEQVPEGGYRRPKGDICFGLDASSD